jgi:hypothetical protein
MRRLSSLGAILLRPLLVVVKILLECLRLLDVIECQLIVEDPLLPPLKQLMVRRGIVVTHRHPMTQNAAAH